MTDQERIAALARQVADLTSRFDDLFEALKFESASTTKHLRDVGSDITELHSFVVPLLHKAFPGIGTDHRHIADLLRRNTKKN